MKKAKKEKNKKKEKKEKVEVFKDLHTAEIRLLTEENLKEIMKVMKEANFDITDGELTHIIKFKMSYGVFVGRKLIGVGLAWPAKFNINTAEITLSDTPNAMYLEDPAILGKYEGKRIRNMLIYARENEAIKRGFEYVVASEPKDPKLKDLIEGAYEKYIRIEKANTVLGKVILVKKLEYPIIDS